MTLPTSTDTLVGRATTDTLTNKTLTLPIISSISNSGTVTIPTGTDTLVNLTGTQTLSNKTLTLPIIVSISNSGTVTIPTGTDTLVNLTGTQTLTNKTLTLPKIASISNTGTLTLPTSTDTLVGRATTDTLTNKTITSTTNTVNASGLFNGSTWTVTNGGSAPSTNMIYTYNGTNAVWASPAASSAWLTTGNALSAAGTLGSTTAYNVNLIYNNSNQIVLNGTNVTTQVPLVVNGAISIQGTNVLNFNQQNSQKMIVLYDHDPYVNTAYNFWGMGVSSSVLNFNMGHAGDFIFYYGNSATTQIQLFDINHAGKVTTINNTLDYYGGTPGNAYFNGALIGGSLFSNTTLTAIGTSTLANVFASELLAGAWIAPTVQGAILGWNRTGGSGQTCFANQQGGGGGGWEWVNYNSSNSISPLTGASATLTSSGILTTAGGITGVTNESSANPGIVGEIITANRSLGSDISISSSTVATVIGVSVTAGDWNITGNLVLSNGTGAGLTQCSTFISNSYASHPDYSLMTTQMNSSGINPGQYYGVTCPPITFSCTSTTSVFVCVYAVFTAGSVGACGNIIARRVR